MAMMMGMNGMNPMMNPMMAMNGFNQGGFPNMNNGFGNFPGNGGGPGMNGGPVGGNMGGGNRNNGVGMNGFNNHNKNHQQQHHPHPHQQNQTFRQNFTTPNNDDDAYFRKPVNPGRHQNKQRRVRPSHYREL